MRERCVCNPGLHADNFVEANSCFAGGSAAHHNKRPPINVALNKDPAFGPRPGQVPVFMLTLDCREQLHVRSAPPAPLHALHSPRAAALARASRMSPDSPAFWSASSSSLPSLAQAVLESDSSWWQAGSGRSPRDTCSPVPCLEARLDGSSMGLALIAGSGELHLNFSSTEVHVSPQASH